MFKYLYLLILLLLVNNNLRAQSICQSVEKDKFEIGYFYREFHRDLDDDIKPWESKWSGNLVMAKYGLFEWITITGGGWISDGTNNNFPNTKFRTIEIGAGIISRITTYKNINLDFASNYYESIAINKSQEGYHKNWRSFNISFQFGYNLELTNMKIFPLFAPLFSYEEILQYNINAFRSKEYISKSPNNFGGIVGTDINLFKYFNLSIYLIYLDYLQYQYGLGINI